MSMTREEFKRAFTEVVSMEFSDIPTQENDIDFTFSQDFIRKMVNLIALQQDGIWRFFNVLRRHVAIIAIVIIGVFISACGANQVITHLYGTIYEEMREEFYAGVTATEIAYVYLISELPEGFEKVSVSKNSGSIISKYHNKTGDEIIFLQDATGGVRMGIRHETIWDDPEREYVTRSSEEIRGMNVELFENKNFAGAIWIEDGYFMEIRFYGCKDLEEVKALVESVNRKE